MKYRNYLSFYKITKYIFSTIRNLIYIFKTDLQFIFVVYFLKDQIVNPIKIFSFINLRFSFISEMKNLSLSNDWFTSNIPYWAYIIKKQNIENIKNIKILEIGSWEGLSSYFILSYLPNSHLTCVDTWEGADEHKSGHSSLSNTLMNIENKFDSNTSKYADRISKFKGRSYDYFSNNLENNFDLIYIDGSHLSDDLMIDAIKSFAALKIGGIIIFDDYLWKYYRNLNDNPAKAINLFLRLKKGQYKILMMYHQVIIQKI